MKKGLMSDRLQQYIISEESATNDFINELTSKIMESYDSDVDCCNIYDHIHEEYICDVEDFAFDVFYKTAEALINVIITFEEENEINE